MKVSKTNVFRLELEMDNCPCHISREYSDPRYTNPLTEPVFKACEKHGANSEISEFAQDMMTGALSSEAQNSGKQYFVPPSIEEGDSAGVVATGETIQRMGVTGLPKRNAPQKARKPNPLAITKLSVDRSSSHIPKHLESLNAAASEPISEEDITITGDIDTAPEDPRVSGLLAAGLDSLEDMLDEVDMKDAGVPRSILNRAKD